MSGSDKVSELLAKLSPEEIAEFLAKAQQVATKQEPQPQPDANGVISLDKAKPSEVKPLTGRSRTPARHIGQVNTGPRPNKFMDMPESQMFQSDTKTDKKLWGKKSSSPRRQKVQKYSIHCQQCQRQFVVTGLSQVKQDAETGEYYYVCDDCILSKANH